MTGGLSESFEVGGYFVIFYFTKESEEYLGRVAGEKHKVGGDLATFDNPGQVSRIFFEL